MIPKNKGKEKEEMAAKYLKKQGYKIIERNFTKRTGEIDIIAKKGHTIVFVEVRSLKEGEIDPSETVNRKKQERILKTARLFLMEHPEFENYDIQFDFVGIVGNKINHIENAFWEEL